MASIDTLVPDIYGLLTHKLDPMERAEPNLAPAFKRQLTPRDNPTPTDPIYASEYGDRCLRKLWYKRNRPEAGEPLAPYVKFKFMYGDSIEELMLALASEAGHKVEREQERVVLKNSKGDEILSGRMDAIIDGCMVDVKSMSTFGFAKLQNEGALTEGNDTFGYRWQTAFYYHIALEEGWIEEGPVYILAADKQLGHIGLFPVSVVPTKEEVAKHAAKAIAAIRAGTLPERGYEDKPSGVSGNRKLDIACSYCPFKSECWPGLRVFLYSRGPEFLTQVLNEPKVPEGHV